MSKFFVGQRVRHVRSLSGRVPVGAEGVVTGVGAFFASGMWADLSIDWRGYGVFVSLFDQVEPILPEGHRAGEEGRCELLDELLERQREAA